MTSLVTVLCLGNCVSIKKLKTHFIFGLMTVTKQGPLEWPQWSLHKNILKLKSETPPANRNNKRYTKTIICIHTVLNDGKPWCAGEMLSSVKCFIVSSLKMHKSFSWWKVCANILKHCHAYDIPPSADVRIVLVFSLYGYHL